MTFNGRGIGADQFRKSESRIVRDTAIIELVTREGGGERRRAGGRSTIVVTIGIGREGLVLGSDRIHERLLEGVI